MAKPKAKPSAASQRHKTSINLSEEAIVMIDEILRVEGGFSRSTVIERAIRAFHQGHDPVQAAAAVKPHREAR